MSVHTRAPKSGAAELHLRIVDEATFAKATGEGRHVAAAYFYFELDALIGCAGQVAADFFDRPQLYTALGRQPIAPRLAELNARCGTDERIPSQAQRDRIYQALFGRSADTGGGGVGDFSRLSGDLIAACATFAERVFDTGEEMLRERVRSAHRPLRHYLTGLAGDALQWSAQEALGGIARERTYPILQNAGICAVFGISTPPADNWPYAPDANADILIEEITKQLGPELLTREAISNRQRSALCGAEALVAVLDFREDGPAEELTSMITRCYTWGAALKCLGSERSLVLPAQADAGMG